MVNIIAEAGVNHFGYFPLAVKLIDAAKNANANFIKLQFINESEVYAPGTYEYGAYDIEEVRKQRRESHLSTEELIQLFDYARNVGIPATATPFGFTALEQLVSLKPPFIKIASGDINFYSLIEKAAESGIKLIISTGMSNLKDVENTVNFLHSEGFDDFVLMHCISIYPHDESLSQLGYISTLQKEFGCEVGFSDHTLGSSAACAAVALGVDWIEKHFTLSKSLGGLDAKHSLEPDEFKEFVRVIQSVSVSLKQTERGLLAQELYTRKRARRGLYAARELHTGNIIQPSDVICLRPETKVAIDEVDNLIGQTVQRTINAFSPFIPSDVGS